MHGLRESIIGETGTHKCALDYGLLSLRLKRLHSKYQVLVMSSMELTLFMGYRLSTYLN